MILTNTIDIAAPPEVVWAVTEDVERWPEWSPTMDSIVRLDDGQFDVGSSARIKQPGLPEAVWTVQTLERGRHFKWSATVRGIHMLGGHEVIPTDGGTRSILTIEMTGWVAKLLGPLMRGSVAKAIAQENEGLKRRCESQASE